VEQSQGGLRALRVSASEQLTQLSQKSGTSVPLMSWGARSAISHENLDVCTSPGSRALLRCPDKGQEYEIRRLPASAVPVYEARKGVFSSGLLHTP